MADSEQVYLCLLVSQVLKGLLNTHGIRRAEEEKVEKGVERGLKHSRRSGKESLWGNLQCSSQRQTGRQGAGPRSCPIGHMGVWEVNSQVEKLMKSLVHPSPLLHGIRFTSPL